MSSCSLHRFTVFEECAPRCYAECATSGIPFGSPRATPPGAKCSLSTWWIQGTEMHQRDVEKGETNPNMSTKIKATNMSTYVDSQLWRASRSLAVRFGTIERRHLTLTASSQKHTQYQYVYIYIYTHTMCSKSWKLRDLILPSSFKTQQNHNLYTHVEVSKASKSFLCKSFQVVSCCFPVAFSPRWHCNASRQPSFAGARLRQARKRNLAATETSRPRAAKASSARCDSWRVLCLAAKVLGHCDILTPPGNVSKKTLENCCAFCDFCAVPCLGWFWKKCQLKDNLMTSCIIDLYKYMVV